MDEMFEIDNTNTSINWDQVAATAVITWAVVSVVGFVRSTIRKNKYRKEWETKF